MSTAANLPISVVIPNYNDGHRLERLLNQLVKMPFSEILVVDGGSSDASNEIVNRHSNISWLTSSKGRGRQIHMGIAKAKSGIVWVLHADSEPPKSAQREILRILARENVGFGCFPIRFDSQKRILTAFAWFSRFDHPLTTFGDQGFFFRRADYIKTEGIEAWPILEDVVLRRQLKGIGGRVVEKSSLEIMTSSRRYKSRGIVKSQLKNLWILLQYFCGVKPAKLYQSYYQ